MKEERAAPRSGDGGKLGRGIKVIALLVSSSSVINFINDLSSMPKEQWLTTVLHIYRSLFYPIVDSTIGLLLRIANISLGDQQRDGIILYSLGFSTMMNAMRDASPYASAGLISIYRSDRRMFWAVFLLCFLWPITMFQSVRDYFHYDHHPDEEGRYVLGYTMSRTIIFAFVKNVFYIIVIVVVALSLNATGRLV